MTKTFKHKPMTEEDKKYLAEHRKNKLNPYMLHKGKPVPLDHPDSKVKDTRLKNLLFQQAEQEAIKKKQRENISRGKVPRTSAESKSLNLKSYGQHRKADGGYVKKYANGGGVRKVRR